MENQEGGLWVSLVLYTATKSRLERELAEAVQDDSEDERRSTSPCSDGGDPGSGSDNEYTSGGVPPVMSSNSTNPMEMSLWSLDASATSSLDTSVTTEVEVSSITISFTHSPPPL